MTGDKKEWAHDLASGVAASFGWFDAPDVVDERLLAQALRNVAADCDNLGHTLLLRSVADALDHPNAEKRLRLGKSKPGRPSSGELFERAFMVGPSVIKLVMAGVKKEAAIQQAMTEFGLSRSAVIRCSSEYEDYRRIFEPGQRDTEARKVMHDTLLALDEVKARSTQRHRKPSKKAGD